MMKFFFNLKKTSFNSHVPHDAAQIIIKQQFCLRAPSATYHFGVYMMDYNCGLACLMDESLFYFRANLTHEISHILGMINDDNTTCTCGRKVCIMNTALSASEAFSNCSYSIFWDAIPKGVA